MPRSLVLVVLVACSPAAKPPVASDGKPHATVASNVMRADYAGSPACEDCHHEIYQRWATSPMRNMTRDAATATVHGPFDGASLAVGPDTATMTTEDGVRYLTHASPAGSTKFRITKIVGGRYREDYVGVDVDHPGVERVLPATYVFSTKSWRYKGYSVMVKERPAMSSRGEWSMECIPCHNTLPLATMLYDDIYGPSLPAYQGKLSDRLLPKNRMWPARSLDDERLAAAIGDEVVFLGGEKPQSPGLRPMLAHAATTTNDKLDGTKLVELGIGCEACHNGARAHATNPDVRPTFAAASPVIDVRPPAGQTGTRAQWITHTCAKCHTVLFSRYPYTWEGGQRMKNPGGSTTNSGEGRDFQLGGCATAMSCTTCHDPHAVDAPGKLAAMATPAGNVTCTSCHPKYATPDAVAAHSHHPVSANVSCIDCHMPKKNMGLDYALVRYHRIGSPTDRARVEGDRPVECALCHRDKSIDQLVTTMETWWRKSYDRAALTRLYGGDLTKNALRAALDGLPHEQAVAIAVLGEARDKTAVPAIARHLAHDYPLVRFYAQRALQKITGDPIAIDLNQSAATIRPLAEQIR